MKKLFEHTDIRGRISERLDVNECGGGVYFAVHVIEEPPIGDIFDERRLSTVIPYSEIPNLIQSLSKFTNGWIDYELKQPTEKGDYLVRDYQGRIAVAKYNNWFYKEINGEKWGVVSHWMTIPELSEKRN